MKKIIYGILLVILFFAIASHIAYGLDTNNDVYWSMDDVDLDGSNITDSSGNGVDGKNTGADTGATGILNEGFDFVKANSDNVVGIMSTSGAVDYSISFWVNFDELNNNLVLELDDGAAGNDWWAFYVIGGNKLRGRFKAGGAVRADLDTATTISIGQWYHIVMTVGSGGANLYVNGVLNATDPDTTPVSTNFDRLKISSNDIGLSYFDGTIDEVATWDDRTLDQTSVTNLYNNGAANNFYAPPTIAIPDINLTDINGNFINGEVSELSFWELSVNATLGGVSDGGFQCNWTAGQLAKVIFDLNENNATVDDGTNYTYTFDVESDNVIEEILSFDVCRVSGTARPLTYSLNNETDYRTIDAGEIPLCSIGTHDETNTTTIPVTDQVNFTISCPTCTPISEFRVVSIVGGLTRWFRVVNPHFSELSFNTTTNRYNDNFTGETFHRHAFPNGLNEVNVTCNDTTQSKTFNVAPAIPNATLLEINGVPFVNGTFIESGNVSIIGDCFGALVILKNLTVTFSNGTLVDGVLDDNINIASNALSIDDNYTVRLECNNALGNSTFEEKFFELRDTTNPTINIIKPDDDIILNSTAQVQIQYTDLNLFGVNVTVDCSVQGNVFSFFLVNLSTTNFFLDNVTDTLTVLQTCTLETEACDQHTLEDFEYDNVRTDVTKRNITVNDEVIMSDYSSYDVREITFIDKGDRISYCYEYETFEDRFKEKIYNYRIPKNNGWMPVISEFQGHYASWDLKQWLDLEPEDGYDLRIDRITEDRDYYLIKTLSNDDKVCFESVGGLNCVIQTFNFSVVAQAPAPDDESSLANITTGQGILLLVMVLIYVVLLLIGAITGISLMYIFAFVIGVVIGIIFIPLQSLFAMAFMLINAALALAILFK